MIEIQITNQQSALQFDCNVLGEAVRVVLGDYGFGTGVVDVAVVDDGTIHSVNREHLKHDYPTDVISFQYVRNAHHIEGELVVSADTAILIAQEAGWEATSELLLYVIHGTLHLVGMDDHSPALRGEMQTKERHYLGLFGIQRCELPAEGRLKRDLF